MTITEVLTVVAIVLGFVLITGIIASCTVQEDKRPTEQEICVKAGGSYVISEQTGDKTDFTPRYECQMP